MKPITDITQLDFDKKYTYADYLTWQFSERVELIKGWIYKMTPAPRRIHQELSVRLITEIDKVFRHKNCNYYTAPFDVRLIKHKEQKDKEIITVVQPDICIICDKTKLDDAGCVGAPDLIVEIISDSTAKKDYNEKFNLYEENGVKEYWIANPATKTIEVFSLNADKYISQGLFNENEGYNAVQSNLFPELSIPLKIVFNY